MARRLLAHRFLPLACLVAACGLAPGCGDTRAEVDGEVPETDAGTMLPPDVDGGTPPPEDGGSMERDASTMPTGPRVDPTCIDGMYTESLPAPDADISDLVAGYDPGDPTAFIEAVLSRRYGTGLELVVEGDSSRDCVDTFLRETGTAQDVIEQLPTVVHECGHFYDNALSDFGSNTYAINDTPLQISCAMGDSTDRGGQTFARSRIRDDAYAELRPPCDGTFGSGCDFYADIYLDGDPDDGTFDGGDQGFNMLFEEVVQYVNSIATAYAFTGELDTGGSTSQRDGILTFLWYLTRYLRMARLDYPSAYTHLLEGDGGCWRDLILTVWGRAWLYLDTTMGMGHLGIADAELMTLVTDPDLLAEIQRLRDAASCP
ncbi:MAG TPA: hypothetical protein RMH99_16075 [Sandaracinaceae bacterium LLY-WYZ-13_1]|nr:hypothetical protein [Sandaracinaceae bacterium LLY-WYZ-13_1]